MTDTPLVAVFGISGVGKSRLVSAFVADHGSFRHVTASSLMKNAPTLMGVTSEELRTANSEIQVPRVIRLLSYEKLPKQTVKFNRRNIFARDNNQCQYCGKKFPTSELSLDHIIPRSQGGQSTWENIVCACVACNVRKGGRTPKEAHMALIRRPEKPRRSPLLNLKLTHRKYQSWRTFLDNAYWSVDLK